jgi:hypothetical protein
VGVSLADVNARCVEGQKNLFYLAAPSAELAKVSPCVARKTRYWVAVPRGLHPLRPNHVSCLTALLSHG